MTILKKIVAASFMVVCLASSLSAGERSVETVNVLGCPDENGILRPCL